MTGVWYILQIKVLVLNSPGPTMGGVPLCFPLGALPVSKKDLSTLALLNNNVSMRYAQEK